LTRFETTEGATDNCRAASEKLPLRAVAMKAFIFRIVSMGVWRRRRFDYSQFDGELGQKPSGLRFFE
jgi:hypothetical protein